MEIGDQGVLACVQYVEDEDEMQGDEGESTDGEAEIKPGMTLMKE